MLVEEFHVFARIIVQDVSMFLRLVDAAQARSVMGMDLFDKLLDQWWRKVRKAPANASRNLNHSHPDAMQFDSMAEPQHRKLTAMAMARLVASGRAAVLKRMSGEIFNLWLDVLGEMKEALAGEDEKCVI